MTTRKTSISLIIAFAVGCGASQLGARFIVPPARAGTSPTRWEYVCQQRDENVSEMASQLGAEGWEMAAATTRGGAMFWCFKRALP